MYRYYTIRVEGLIQDIEDKTFLEMEARLSAIPNENWGGPNIITSSDNYHEITAPNGETLEFGDTELTFITTAEWYMVDDVIQRVYDILDNTGADYSVKVTLEPEGEKKITRSEYEWHRCR